MSSILTLDGWPCIPAGISAEERAEIDRQLAVYTGKIRRTRPRNGYAAPTEWAVRTRLLVAFKHADRPLEASELRWQLSGGQVPARLVYEALLNLFRDGVVLAVMRTGRNCWGRPCRYPVFWTD